MAPGAGASPNDHVFFSQHNHLDDEIAALDDALGWRQTNKDPVFFSRHNTHLNDEIAALDDALSWRRTKRSCFLFPAQSPE